MLWSRRKSQLTFSLLRDGWIIAGNPGLKSSAGTSRYAQLKDALRNDAVYINSNIQADTDVSHLDALTNGLRDDAVYINTNIDAAFVGFDMPV